jgi:hypothetical protein
MEALPSGLIEAALIFFNNFNKAFIGKIFHLVEEKGYPLGLEPVLECLPSTRFKSRKNVVHDTVCYKADDSW